MIDIEKLMREGKSLDEIGVLITNEMNATQEKLNKEAEEKRIAAEKKKKAEAAAKAKKANTEKARAAAVTALTDYFALVMADLGMSEQEIKEYVSTALSSVETTVRMMKNIKITFNGKDITSMGWLDLLRM